MRILFTALSILVFSLYNSYAQSINDIGVISIDSPQIAFCGSSSGIFVKVKNYGHNKVDSFIINWSINGNMQQPVKIDDALDTAGGIAASQALINLGSYSFSLGVPVMIRAWTSLPNGVADSDNNNDSSFAVRTASGMAGNYTVNPFGSGPLNFTTLDDAVNALSVYGVCGATVINVAAGVYTRSSSLTIGNIVGSSVSKTITFKGSGSSSCFISGNVNPAALLILNQSRNIIVRDIAFTNNAQGNPRCIEVVGAAKNISVINCSLKVPVALTTADLGLGINITGTAGSTSAASQADSILIENNNITGGNYGIHFYGAESTTTNRGVVVNMNTINDVSGSGIRIVSIYNPLSITKNVITMNQISSSIGISTTGQNSGAVPTIISGNRIYNFRNTGIVFNFGSTSTSLIISNNVVVSKTNDQFGLTGISLSTASNNTHVYYNTVLVGNMRMVSSAPSEAAFFSGGASTQIYVKNNIFYATGGSTIPVYLQTELLANRINNNLYYNSGSDVLLRRVSNYFSSSNYKATLAGGDSAYNVLPPLVDVRSVIPNLNLRHGCFLTGSTMHFLVSTDINNNARKPIPNIGAYEYYPLNDNISVLDMLTPSLVLPTAYGLQNLRFTVINAGNNPVLKYQAAYRKNADPVITQGKSVNMQPCAIDTVVFTGTSRINIESVQDLMVYTASPNDSIDSDYAGDTLTATVTSSLKGTYTVGGINPDFATPQLAYNAAKEKGVWGDVIFSIRPGIYNGQVKVSGVVPGLSDTSSITFEGIDAATTIIAADTASATFLIDQVSNINVKNLTIRNLKQGYGIGILSPATGRANSCKITRCIINLPEHTTSTGVSGYGITVRGNLTTPAAFSNLLIDSNRISGGGYGIDINGSSTSSTNNNIVVSNNVINKCNETGIYVYGVYNPVMIKNNRLQMAGKISGKTGLLFSHNQNDDLTSSHEITGNIIHDFSEYGIYITNPGSVNSALLLYNNEIVPAFGAAARYGIYLQLLSNNKVNCYHNTIAFESTVSNSRAMYTNGSSAVIIKNNVFSVYNAGTPLTVASTVTNGNINNNLYYSKRGTGLIERASTMFTAATYKTLAAGGDLSFNEIPPFVNYDGSIDSFNVQFNTSCLNLYGANLTGSVPQDINGITRITTPTVGAHEFVMLPNNLAVITELIDSSYFYHSNNNHNLSFTVRNEGLNWITDYSAGYIKENGAAVTLNKTKTLARCETDTVVFTGTNQLPFSRENNLKLFTYNPNNVQDANIYNDTLKVKIHSALAGDYIVGSSPSDFATINEAVGVLNRMGISSSVRFLIKTGTYDEYISLDSVKGSSAINTVRFTSAAQHVDSVVISRATNVIRLNTKANHFIFEKLTISVLNVGNNKAFTLEGTASFDTIRDCRITMPVTALNYNLYGVYGDDYSGTGLHVYNNIIQGGFTSIYLEGNNRSYPMKDVSVVGNTLSGFYSKASRYAYSLRGAFDNNVINQPSAAINYSIEFLYTDSGFKITNNIVNTVSSPFTWSNENSRNSPDAPFTAANNVIRGTGNSSFQFGLNFINAVVAHNTFNLNTGYFYSRTTFSSGLKVFNNIFAGSGSYVYFSGIASDISALTSDYNFVSNSSSTNLYRVSSTNYTGQAFRNLYPHLESYSVLNESLNANVIPDPLNSNSWKVNGMGVHTDLFATDKNGIPRPVNAVQGAPDIGAYEITPSVIPAQLLSTPVFPSPNSTQTFLNGVDTAAKIKWNTAVPYTINARLYNGVYPPGIDSNIQRSLNMYWDFNVTGTGTYSYDISLYYRYPLRGSITSIANMIGAKRSGANPWVSYDGASVVIDSARNILTIKGLTDFSLFTGTDLSNPLPVKLIDFTGTNLNNSVMLKWHTAEEKNASHFELYVSEDGNNYTRLGRNMAANGNSHSKKQYQFIDADAFSQVRNKFYKLKSVDLNGDHSWSNVVNVSAQKIIRNNITIYPNPFGNAFTIMLQDEGNAILEISDPHGKKVYENNVVIKNGKIDIGELEGLKPGVYYVSVKTDQKVYAHKLVKH